MLRLILNDRIGFFFRSVLIFLRVYGNHERTSDPLDRFILLAVELSSRAHGKHELASRPRVQRLSFTFAWALT